MKNKHTILLLGIGLYYLLYKMYSKKSNVITKSNLIQQKLNPDDYLSQDHNIKTDIPKQFLVDKVNVSENVVIPNTYQTFYVKPTNQDIEESKTYQTYYGAIKDIKLNNIPNTYQTIYSKNIKICVTNKPGIKGISTKVPCTC